MCARAVFIILTTSALLACVAPAPLPQDHFYRLPEHVATSTDNHPAPRKSGILSVKPFSAHGLYRDRAILYVDMAHPLQVNSYHYHYWLYSPSILLQDRFIDYLRAHGAAEEVRRFTTGDHLSMRLGGRIVRFERLINDTRSEVVVELEMTLHSPSNSTPERLKQYRSRVAVDGDDMDAVVSAFGKAVDEICRNFVADLATIQP